MASNGSFNTTDYAGRYLTFAWSQKSQDITNNKTTITWTLKGAGGDANKWYWCGNVTVVIAGSTVFTLSSSNAINLWAGTQVASGEFTFTHNSDGTKTFSASVAAGIYVHEATRKGSDTFTLNTIARASQPSCVTWPEHTQNVGDFGTTISIHMNRKSDAFTHTVRYEFGSQSGTIANSVGTGTTWTIPLNLMHLIPNSTSGSGTIYVDTYSGSTKIGTKSCGFTATVPASVKPTCSLSLVDITGVGDIYGVPVQGLSKIKITVNASIIYSSPIVSYAVTANGASYTTKESTTNVLKDADSSIVSATIKDGRGRTASASYTMRPLPYSKPSITKVSTQRSDANGTANDQGKYIRVVFSASVSALNNKNVSSYSLRYKKSTATSYTQVSLTSLANKYTVDAAEYIFAADETSSYDIEIVASDSHNTTTKLTNASTALSLMDFGPDGTSIGLLKVAERPRAIDVGGDIYMNGHAVYGAHGMHDTRDDNETPEWYMTQYGRGSVWEFKLLTAIGFTSPSSNYGPVETIIPWKDSSGGLPRQVAYEGRTRWTRIASSLTAWGAWQSDALLAYPVGSIYISYNHTNPATLFGGTWTRIENAFLWGVDSSGTIGQTGGEEKHTLTVNEMPAHTHGSVYSQHASGTKDKAWYSTAGSSVAYGTVSTGGGAAHNNMPPYIQVSIWRRTA